MDNKRRRSDTYTVTEREGEKSQKKKEPVRDGCKRCIETLPGSVADIRTVHRKGKHKITS